MTLILRVRELSGSINRLFLLPYTFRHSNKGSKIKGFVVCLKYHKYLLLADRVQFESNQKNPALTT